jgi:hypothetical protein
MTKARWILALAFLFSSLCVTIASAQVPLVPKPRFSIEAGPHFAALIGDGSPSYSEPKIGFAAGAEVSFVPKNIGFQSGLLYVQKGCGISSGAKYNLNYLVIPMMLRINMVPPVVKVKPHFLLGPELGFLMGANIKHNGNSTDIKDSLKGFDPGIRSAFGVDVANITCSINVAFGLSSIYEAAGAPACHNISWGLMVGGNF